MTILTVQHLSTHFPITRGLLQRRVGTVYALNDVSFDLNEQETIGIVGESGCGKSTLARTLMRLLPPTAGTFHHGDHSMQMVFQDPNESINPTFTVFDAVAEPFVIHTNMSKAARRARVAELLQHVGLDDSAMTRYIHEFSGGQRQRVCIARALALQPRLMLLDEPVSALDVSIQAQILNLLLDLQAKFALSYLFISHNLSVIHHIADRVIVMYLGSIVEVSRAEDLFLAPLHPYTQALLEASPSVAPRRRKERLILRGEIPSSANPPPGCAFHTRCLYAKERCHVEKPQLTPKSDGSGRSVACFYPLG